MNEEKEEKNQIPEKKENEENLENKEDKFSKPKLNSAIEVFKESVSEWWKNIKGFSGIFGWTVIMPIAPIVAVAILAFILSSVQDLFVVGNSFQSVFSIGSLILIILLIGAFFAAILFSMYFSAKGYLSYFLFAKNNYEGGAKEIFFKKSEEYIWPFIGITLLSSILVLLWSLLLIIPGIIFSVFYTFAVYVLLFEGKRDMKNLNRSKELVKNYFWPILGRILFIAIILCAFIYILSLPITVMGIEEGKPLYVLVNVILNLIILYVTPVVIIFMQKIYKNLVKIKG